VLARLTGAIAGIGGNIISLVVYGCSPDGECRTTLKICDVEESGLREVLTGLGIRVIDLRSA
jgi:hypothetical protein